MMMERWAHRPYKHHTLIFYVNVCVCVCVSLWRTFPLRTQVGDGYGGMQKNQFWGAVCLQTSPKSKAYVFLQLNIETHFKFTEWVGSKVSNVMVLGGILGEVLRFQWRDIKEAIVRAAWRMSYFTHFVQQRAFVPPRLFPLWGHTNECRVTHEVWVTCSLSQGWTQWPCAWKAASPRKAGSGMQEAAAALCARRLQTTSVVRREFYSHGPLVCQGLKSLLLLLLRDCGVFFLPASTSN